MTYLLIITLAPSPIPSQSQQIVFDIISLGVDAVLCHDQDTCKTVHTCARSLFVSEQIVPSVETVGGRKKLRAVGRVRKASKRSRSAAEVSPHHAGDAYYNLAKTAAWKTVCRASVGKPWCRRVHNANNDYAQHTKDD